MADDTRPLDQLTPLEQQQRFARTAAAPAWRLNALIAALIAKGLITTEDLEKADARSP